ncbi:MAG: hypothetical protein ABWX63_10050 [Paeniglutamicibacter terrestris]
MANLFHRNSQATVHHHGGGSIILGGVLAALLFATFAIFLMASQGTWEPMIIGFTFSISAVLFGLVYHYTH